MLHPAVLVFMFICCLTPASSRRHTLILKNDPRPGVLCSQFAFGAQGSLSVELTGLVRENLGMKQKSGSCLLDKLTDKRVLTLRMGKKKASLKSSSDRSIFVIAGSKSLESTFIFRNAEDEKSLQSLKLQISKFFIKYIGSTEEEAESLSSEIVNAIISNENLRIEIVELVKPIVTLELAVYETFNRLLSSRTLKDDEEFDEVESPLKRNRREAPQIQESNLKKQLADQKGEGHPDDSPQAPNILQREEGAKSGDEDSINVKQKYDEQRRIPVNDLGEVQNSPEDALLNVRAAAERGKKNEKQPEIGPEEPDIKSRRSDPRDSAKDILKASRDSKDHPNRPVPAKVDNPPNDLIKGGVGDAFNPQRKEDPISLDKDAKAPVKNEVDSVLDIRQNKKSEKESLNSLETMGRKPQAKKVQLSEVKPNVNAVAEKNNVPQDSKFPVVGRVDEGTGQKQKEAALNAEKLESKESLPIPLSGAVLEAMDDAISVYASTQGGESLPYVFSNGKVSLNFTITFTTSSFVGAYDLIFHNCLKSPIDVSISMVERNGDNYLSLGEQPLAVLFLVFSLIYAVLSVLWGLHLRFSEAPVFRIHHLMLAMVIVKSISLMFHSINYYVIGKHGVQEEGWAVMYYIAHMTRGFLLIVTIFMIGAGWTLIKHIFTRREKQVFLIVIPLQVLANIATIVINETEQGATLFAMWNEIFIVVDLLCCAGVLFPVIWSIRHLRQAAKTDGKVAQNLRKLRLFRHFYILVICYIYFTRIVVYLLRMTAPFTLFWLVELFDQTVTLAFYVSVGCKFRPFNDNPYLQLPTSEDQEMEDIVMQRFDIEEARSQSGLAEGVTRIHRPQGIEAARDNRRRRSDMLNRPLRSDAEADDSDLLPLIRP